MVYGFGGKASPLLLIKHLWFCMFHPVLLLLLIARHCTLIPLGNLAIHANIIRLLGCGPLSSLEQGESIDMAALQSWHKLQKTVHNHTPNWLYIRTGSVRQTNCVRCALPPPDNFVLFCSSKALKHNVVTSRSLIWPSANWSMDTDRASSFSICHCRDTNLEIHRVGSHVWRAQEELWIFQAKNLLHNKSPSLKQFQVVWSWKVFYWILTKAGCVQSMLSWVPSPSAWWYPPLCMRTWPQHGPHLLQWEERRHINVFDDIHRTC